MTPTALAVDVVALSAQFACVIALAGLLSLVVRIDRAEFRYQYWRAVLVLCVLLPWLQRRQSAAAHAVEAIMTRALPPAATVLVSSADIVAPAHGVAWLRIGLWIVLAGIALRLAYVGFGLVRLGRLRRAGHVGSLDAHDEMQRALGTRAEIRYTRSGQPVTWGVWRPVVVLPESLLAQPAEIQRAVVAHELLHVKRRDWLWVLGEELLRSVIWFHPGIWWLVARVRLAREEAVDEFTVRVTGQRRAYLEALLAFADATPFAPGAAFGRRRSLFRRMTLISKEVVMSSRRTLISFAVLVVGVVAGSWYAVSAFPLMQVPGTIQPAAPSASDRPGPLESGAKAITLENPIPRRTYSVAPKNPGAANPGPAAVTLRLTINALGRVGEARLVGTQPAENAQPSNVFVRAGLDAVRQWVYDPPADAPISFNVTFLFAPNSDPRLVAHGTPLPGPGSAPAGGVVRIVPPPPPPAPPWVREGVVLATPVRVGGNIMPPTKVKDVRPLYPEDAKIAGVQGVVILEATIGPDGRVDRLAVLRSIPQLDYAAIEAVKEWEFTPTMLNGIPVPVIMTVTVNFALQ